MKLNLAKLTINQKLAVTAILLGFVAIFMHDPTTNNIANIDVAGLALQIQNKSAQVTVDELASWLIEKKADFTLIDLRSVPKFLEYNIPSSINTLPAELTKISEPKTKKILLYSDDNMAASQAWLLLKSKNYKNVYVLSGGINEWKDKILFPSISENTTPEEKAKFDKLVEISKFFGGSPRLASAGGDAEVKPQVVMPKITAPVASPQGQAGKPKREGC